MAHEPWRKLGVRTIIFDEDGPHDMGDLGPSELHNAIAAAVGEEPLPPAQPALKDVLIALFALVGPAEKYAEYLAELAADCENNGEVEAAAAYRAEVEDIDAILDKVRAIADAALKGAGP